MGDSSERTIVCTPIFLAPELLELRNKNHKQQ